jgi:DNA-directed RNA polymerase beta subunit
LKGDTLIRISDFIKTEDLINFQIESFNCLLEKGLQEVIEDRGRYRQLHPGVG